ncbi:MAG TPA: anthranilate phosphoribosyltransferase, partial [Gammaproteobacteria bacterium]|nr:anthranilate phosphoribosyltransferase [Gammaproteobacteria bacterium]
IVHGNGLDEISCVGPIKITEIHHDKKIALIFDPLDFGFQRCAIEDLQGGDAKTNAELLLNTFKGKSGPIADTLILNAAFALYIYGKHFSISDAIIHAHENLYDGSALTLLKKWTECSYE